MIDKYTQIVQEVSPTTTVKKFISGIQNRDEVLSKFSTGDIEVLTSMKCLDEGVEFQEANLQFSVQVQEIQDNLSSVVVVY